MVRVGIWVSLYLIIVITVAIIRGVSFGEPELGGILAGSGIVTILIALLLFLITNREDGIGE